MQTYSSKNTSINSTRLPSAVKKIDWQKYQGSTVLDIGGGKFDNLKDYLKGFNITLFIYDPYNRTDDENRAALDCNPDLVICNNVLNVIDSDESIRDVIVLIQSYKVPFVISVYEGNRSGVGVVSGKDQYQRNVKTKEYSHFFDTPLSIKNGLIMG